MKVGVLMTEKIKILLIKKGMTVTNLAEKLNVTPQNLYNKFKRDNFSVKELQEIATVLEVEFEFNFVLEDGTKI